MPQTGISVKNFAQATGGTFYIGGVPYDSTGAMLVSPWTSNNSAGLMRCILMGDSMTAQNAGNTTLTSVSRSNNVVTCVGASGGTGALARIYNCLDTSFNTNSVEITRVDSNTFTYPSTGANGSTSDLTALKPMQVQFSTVCNDNGYMFWLQSKTGGALKVALNAGCNGQTAADMRSRYATDVIGQSNYDLVILLTGYNDFAVAGRTAAAVYADVVAMATQSAAIGNGIIIVSALPWTTGGTATDRKEALKYNRMIREWCNTQRGVRFADAAKYLIDATNATAFSPLSNMLQSDGIHPSPKGAERIAQAIYDVLQYDAPRVSRLVSCSLDNYGNDSTNKNILDAAPWTTSGGALAGGTTGTSASGMAVTLSGGTAVASVVSRSDGIGYNQRVIFTPSANNDSVTISGTGYITGRFSVGDYLNYLGELSLSGMSGANIKSIEIYITYNNGNSIHYLAKAAAANNSSYPATDTTISFASLVDSVIPSGTTGVGWTIIIKAGAAGTALTAELGRQSLAKVA